MMGMVNVPSGSETDVFQRHFSEGSLVAPKSLDGVENFDAGQSAVFIIICGNALGEVLCRHGYFEKTDVEGIDIRVIGYPHQGSSLAVVYINGHDDDISFFFDKYGAYRFCLVMFSVPIAVKRHGHSTFQTAQVCGLPRGRPDGGNDLILRAAAKMKLFLCMFAQSNRLFRFQDRHLLGVPKPRPVCNRFADRGDIS